MKTKKAIIAAFLVFSLLGVSLFMGMRNEVTYAALDENNNANDYYLFAPINDETNPFISYGSDTLESNTTSNTIYMIDYDGTRIPIKTTVTKTLNLVYYKRTNAENFYVKNLEILGSITSLEYPVYRNVSYTWEHTEYIERVNSWSNSWSLGSEISTEFTTGVELGVKAEAKIGVKLSASYSAAESTTTSEGESYTTSITTTINTPYTFDYGPGVYAFQLRGNITEYKIELVYSVSTVTRRPDETIRENNTEILETELFRVVENRPETETNGYYKGPYIRLMKIDNLPF